MLTFCMNYKVLAKQKAQYTGVKGIMSTSI